MLKVFNVIGVIVLLLLLRKLIWCLRWLWCWRDCFLSSEKSGF